VSRSIARVVSTVALLACVGSFVGAGVLFSVAGDRVPRGEIVVVGDPTAPGMEEVVNELRTRMRLGDDLISGGESGGWIPLAAVVVLLIVWVGIGVLIVFRQPTHWAGWLFIITGAPFPILGLAQVVMVYGLKVDPGSVPFISVWATVGEFALYPLALIPLLFLLYPDGHLPSPRWRWSVIGLIGGTAVAFLAFVFRPGPFNNWRDDGIVFENPFGIDAFAPAAGTVIAAGTIVALVSGLSAVAAIVLRFRRSTGEARQQMRLLAFVGALAGSFIIAMFVGGFLAEALIGEGGDEEVPIFPILFGLAAFTIVIGVPIAYLFAIFRYRLWDLDVVIRKTVVAIVVTVLLALIAVVAFTVAGSLAIGGGDVANAAVVGIVIGLLVLPTVRLARRIANRLVYGKRATPYEVLTAFGARVGETYSTEDVLPRMARLLAEATAAEQATVWVRVGAELHAEAAFPTSAHRSPVNLRGDDLPPIGDEHAVDVRHQGDLLGALSVRIAPNDPMNPGREKLMRDLAAQAGLVLRNVSLIEELRASRQRLVAAQDEERRRIERNLHDGAQQQLVALNVQLRLAEQMVGRDANKEREIIHRLQNAANDALEDLRDLARGIYPPLLADKGLPAALEAQARKSPVPVTVDPDGVGRYPRDVESAVYFCTLEALNNVAKYADASAARVRLQHSDGALEFEVEDDGRGFDPASAGTGTGLQGMADRLDAIGGTLGVRSAPGRGTTIAGRVPVEMESS
jgi:signal transduction histidine kinase